MNGYQRERKRKRGIAKDRASTPWRPQSHSSGTFQACLSPVILLLPLASTASLPVVCIHKRIRIVDIVPAPPAKVGMRQCFGIIGDPSLNRRAFYVDSRLVPPPLVLLVLHVRVVVHELSLFSRVRWRTSTFDLTATFALRVMGLVDVFSVSVVASAVRSVGLVAGRVSPVQRARRTLLLVEAVAAVG